jgi:SAM-dependent methyltransferase
MTWRVDTTLDDSLQQGTAQLMPLDLPEGSFRRHDETPDTWFYSQPRFVEHIDDGAIAAVAQLYRDFFSAGGRVLDLMSSWVSHLPPEIAYGHVVGLGLNEEELAVNPRLDAYLVHNLNTKPVVPLDDAAFDAAAICVSIQYLTHPLEVLRDLGRVLTAGSPLVVTFSNRCFPTKAVAIWQSLDDAGHAQLVTSYLQDAGNWSDIRALDRTPDTPGADPLLAVVALSARRDQPC